MKICDYVALGVLGRNLHQLEGVKFVTKFAQKQRMKTGNYSGQPDHSFLRGVVSAG